MDQSLQVPDDNDSFFRSGDSNVESSFVFKKAQSVVSIAADSNEHDNIFFAALAFVDAVNQHLVWALLRESFSQFLACCVVWCEESNFCSFDIACRKQALNDFFGNVYLLWICVAVANFRIVAICMDKAD